MSKSKFYGILILICSGILAALVAGAAVHSSYAAYIEKRDKAISELWGTINGSKTEDNPNRGTDNISSGSSETGTK